MTIDGKKKKKDQKKKESQLEAQIFAILEKSLKAVMDQALNDIFKDWQ